MKNKNNLKKVFNKLLPCIAERYEEDPREYWCGGMVEQDEIIKILLNK